MSFSSVRSWLQGASKSTLGGRPEPGSGWRPKRTFRPGLESLDERIVPAAVLPAGDVTGSSVGVQYTIGSDRTVARSSSSGNYAVVWRQGNLSRYLLSTTYGGIFVRLFRADNTPLTAPMHIYSTDYVHDFSPSIAMNSSGQFAVAWMHKYDSSNSSTGLTDTDIIVQRFNANGTPTYQRLATSTAHNETEPSVALDQWGNLMVAYTCAYSSSDTDVYVWTERTSGVTDTTHLATSGDNEHNPSLAVNSWGSGVVAYESDYGDYDHDVYARRVSTGGWSGTPGALGGTISVNTDGEYQRDPSVSINNSNNFVVSYTEEAEFVEGYGVQVFAQQFDSSNNTRGGVGVGAFLSIGFRDASSVSMDDNGRFIVAYEHYDGTNLAVQARVFNSDNTARGPEFYVAALGGINQFEPTVALGITDLTSNYSGGGYSYGQAVFAFQTYGLKLDPYGNMGDGISVAEALNL
jgi:hypothetical protein